MHGSMIEKGRTQHGGDMDISGGSRARNILGSIHIVNATHAGTWDEGCRQRWSIIGFRTAEIQSCSGIVETGKRWQGVVTVEKQ